MLNRLRNAAKSWSVRLFLFVLLLCFVFLWGTSNFTGVQQKDVFIAGKSKITDAVYNYTLQQELFYAQMQLKNSQEPLTNEEIHQYGILQKVENRLIQDVLVQEQTRIFPIGVTKNQVAKAIGEDIKFYQNNVFNKDYFIRYAQYFGLTPKLLTDIIEQEQKNKQFLSTITSQLHAPKTIVEAFKRYQRETRDIRYIKLTPDQFMPPVPPKDEELKAWLNAHADEYKTPEYRTISTITLDQNRLAKADEISSKEIEDYYNKHADIYKPAEKRSYRIVTFDTLEEAQKAQKELQKTNRVLEFFTKQYGQKSLIKRDISLKDLETTLGTAIFGLKLAQTSDIIVSPKLENKTPTKQTNANGSNKEVAKESANKTAQNKVITSKETTAAPNSIVTADATKSDKKQFSIVNVFKIVPTKITPLKDVENNIKTILLNEKRKKLFDEKQKTIMADYLKKKTLPEIAKAQNLTVKDYHVDANGYDENKNQILNKQDILSKNLLKATFEALPLKITPAVDNEDKTKKTWFIVTKVIPSRPYRFDEIKDKLLQRWNDEQRQTMLEKESQDTLRKLNEGIPLDTIAHESDLDIIQVNNIERTGTFKDLGIDAISTIFSTHKNKFNYSKASNPKERVIFQVLAVKDNPENLSSNEQQAFAKEIDNYFNTTLLLNVLDYLRSQTNLRVNPEAYQKIMSRY